MSNYLWSKKVIEPEVQLPERDARVLEKYTARMKRFDEMVKICCCWIGYDILLEFIPVVGKVISLMYALSMYRLACQCELPRPIKRRLIPILGILLDMLYRAHSKNARILRRFLYERARKGTNEAGNIALQAEAEEDLSGPSNTMLRRDRQINKPK
ncbi:hypothetical protein A0J61_04535 [Choanephora cucurbitarum]|uniref:Uncharacterized protein n=1 Tax=Choanephora cucurbitarum TaxID=101091 RepID=A0A1C7NJF0_9FUNG|nr:hypothetical protein A0J61_04535 [Choanephora cucurbitarum]